MTCGRLILELEPDAVVECITCETAESNLAYGQRTLRDMAKRALHQDSRWSNMIEVMMAQKLSESGTTEP